MQALLEQRPATNSCLRFQCPIALACYNGRVYVCCTHAALLALPPPDRFSGILRGQHSCLSRNAVLYFRGILIRALIPLITFDSFCLLLRHKTYSLLSATRHIERLAGLHVQSVGLPVLRSIHHHLKPTMAVLQH